MNRAYLDAVRLLLAVAPVIFQKPTFALKGGTAINLFVRDMPRLSVDLDLVFTVIPSMLSGNQRSFLMSLAEAQPDWSLMSCQHLAEMPALRWKLFNLEHLRSSNSTKFAQQSSELKKRFGA